MTRGPIDVDGGVRRSCRLDVLEMERQWRREDADREERWRMLEATVAERRKAGE